MKTLPLCLISFLVGSFGMRTAVALTINPTWDISVTSLADAALWESGFTSAIREFEDNFSDPITLNITFKANPGTSIFGHSNYSVQGVYTFSEILDALQSHSTSSADASAITSLTSDPTGGGNFVLNDAQAKALGLRSATNPSTDGTVTIGTGYDYTFSATRRAVSGEYDFIGIVEHEISEVMGRSSGLGAAFGSGKYSSVYEIFDLFRYTASRAPTVDPNDTGVYFSINGGSTNLRAFNSTPGEDLQDWAGKTPYSADAFNAISFSGYKNALTTVDLTAMDVIGYTRAVPEPATLSLLVAALALVGFTRKWPRTSPASGRPFMASTARTTPASRRPSPPPRPR
jgi:hypothetical protein